MIKREEIFSNINTDYAISADYLKESRYGLCRYISDICNSIDISNDIASIAMVYVNHFFIKKSYLNYEKLIIACASILLACKYENTQGKLNEICKAYMQYNYKIFGQSNNVVKAEEIKKIKDKINLAEVAILKCLNYEINVSLPNDYIYVYAAILYPENEEEVFQYSLRIAYDSFFTYANLLYKNYVVAIANIIIAAKFLALPTPMDKNFKNLENMKMFSIPPATEDEFNKRLLNYENKSFHMDSKAFMSGNGVQGPNENSYFDILEWDKKIHPYIEVNDLVDCMKMIMEYYEDAMKNNNADKSKSTKDII